MIGSIAKNVHMLNSQVIWSQMALEAAKAEGKPPTFLTKVKKVISQAIMEHDQVCALSTAKVYLSLTYLLNPTKPSQT